MSAEHRKPTMAFIVLAIMAAAVVGMQRADAQGGRMFAAVVGAGVSVQGTLPQPELPAWSLEDAALIVSAPAVALAGSAEAPEESDADTVVTAAAAAQPVTVGARPAQVRAGKPGPAKARTTKARPGQRARATTIRTKTAIRPDRDVVATSLRSTGTSSVTSPVRTHRPASSGKAAATSRRPVVRQDHRPTHARAAKHGNAHRKAQHRGHRPSARAFHRASPRAAFRR